jgi:hypothetical protein
MKQYYKVVRPDGKRLMSAVMGKGIGRSLECVYSTTQWTEGVEGTPVIAFEDRASAAHWAPPGSETWEAQAKRPRKINRLSYYENGKQTLVAFWKSIEGKRWSALSSTHKGQLAPQGTVACEAIRLVRRVPTRRRS